jgi:hypothetical protein
MTARRKADNAILGNKHFGQVGDASTVGCSPTQAALVCQSEDVEIVPLGMHPR